MLREKLLVNDRLYGPLKFDQTDLRLFQTEAMTRLRQVSLSAVPTWTIPASVCASKFEHSLGVGHLAKILGKNPEFYPYAKDLYFASLAHDIGTPPFSHASEPFQKKILGKNHEEFAADVIKNSDLAEEIKNQGGSIKRIFNFIEGKDKPISDLINGTIDLDNLDNSLRYGISMGLLSGVLYSPEKLVQAFTLRNEQLVMLPGYQKELLGWEKCRKIVYDFVFSQSNLSSGMMLFRALDFAVRENELKKEYFMMTDEKAFTYLLKCNEKTKTLVERTKNWNFYQRAVNERIDQPADNLKNFIEQADNRSWLADYLAESLHLNPEDICVYMGKNRGFKKIHLPIMDKDDKEIEYQPLNEQFWMLQVYLYRNILDKTKKIKELTENFFINL